MEENETVQYGNFVKFEMLNNVDEIGLIKGRFYLGLFNSSTKWLIFIDENFKKYNIFLKGLAEEYYKIIEEIK